MPSANARFLHRHERETWVSHLSRGAGGDCRTLFNWSGRIGPRAFLGPPFPPSSFFFYHYYRCRFFPEIRNTNIPPRVCLATILQARADINFPTAAFSGNKRAERGPLLSWQLRRNADTNAGRSVIVFLYIEIMKNPTKRIFHHVPQRLSINNVYSPWCLGVQCINHVRSSI